MTPRERVLTALEHREPDRVPIDIGACGPTGVHVEAYRSWLAHVGRDESIRLWDVVGQLAEPSEESLDLLGADVRGVRAGPRGGPHVLDARTLRDAWGITWHRPETATCYNILTYPLRDAPRRDLDRYPWPEGVDPVRLAGLADRARQLHEEGQCAVLGEISGHVLERGQMLRGFDTFLVDLLEDQAYAEELMDRIVSVELSVIEPFLDAVGPCLDVFALKDDLGTQTGPVVSPALFRRLIKPRLAKLIEAVKARTKARIWFHSCGSAYYAIRDLLDIGVEILNPVQVRARHMDPARLKREFGKNLSFWGGIDTQGVLPFGGVEDVEAEVRLRLSQLAPGGGYVFASCHNIEADVPGANVEAMFRCAREWGRYPLAPALHTVGAVSA